MPPVENYQNHAQKSAIGDTGGIGGILSSSWQASINESMFNCYYCDCFQTSNEKEYQRHIVLRHPGKLAYPSKIDIEKMGS
jgi:hypothetical protein